MKINTTFNIGDTAYILENEECYRFEIKRIEVVIKDGVDVEYSGTKFIPAWILKETEKWAAYWEEQLFLTKWEVKDKLKEIKKHREKKEELEAYMKDDTGYFNARDLYKSYISAATALDTKTI